jgi:2-hydroxycyclohexanecarboxyl-CoA dehydrogenase
MSLDMQFDFADQSVVIAGGTSGVGLATAIAFADNGCRRLVVVGRNEERGKAAVDAIQGVSAEARVDFISADLNEPDGAQEAADEAARRLGGIDVLVNSTVAPYQPTLLHEIPLAELRSVLVEQSVGSLLMTRAVLPVMRAARSGSIISIASDAAKVPTPGETGIGAAMAAIITFCRTLALEAKNDGIRVNVLTPSLITDTASYDRAMSQEFSKKIFERIVKRAGLGLTEPDDLAATALFLASPLSRRITGQVISVNGGISIA